MPFSPEEYKGPKEFCHWHNHTVFSKLDGVATPEQYAEQCHLRGYPAMTATEHGHMGSVPDMYLAFRKYGIKYVPGCEIYFSDYEEGTNFDKIPSRQEFVSKGGKLKELKATNPEIYDKYTRNRHLTLLAKNETGFHNLIKLTTQAYKTSFGLGRTKFPRIGFEKLCQFKEGLIILSGCLNGPPAHELRLKTIKHRKKNPEGGYTENVVWESKSESDRFNAAARWIRAFKREFGEDYYIELQMPNLHDTYDEEVFVKLVALADHYRIRRVLTNDAHYLVREDFILQKIMMAISQQMTIDDPDLFHVNSDEQFMKTRAELWSMFRNHGYSHGVDDRVFEEMCDNTLLIAERCEPLKIDSNPKFPQILNDADQLRILVRNRLKELGAERISQRAMIDGRNVNYVEQAKIELDRFIDKGFASYFLITKDLVNFGRQRGWPFSPRGCAVPGSLVIMADNTNKPIEAVEIGDIVRDGFDNTQMVQNKFIYNVSEQLINVEFDNSNVIITADHKLYIIRDNNVELIKAKYLTINDQVINTGDTKLINDLFKVVMKEPQASSDRNIDVLNYLRANKPIGKAITSIRAHHYIGNVYDIQVSNTNCYSLNGIFSSNSAGGSLVCYLLGIHVIDPMRWEGLSFDRFLSPSRGGYMLDLKMGNSL